MESADSSTLFMRIQEKCRQSISVHGNKCEVYIVLGLELAIDPLSPGAISNTMIF